MRPLMLLAGVALLTAACTDDTGLELKEGYRAEVLVEDLEAPTQFAHGPDGRLWVAQFAGDPDAGAGQVVAVPTGEVGEPEIVFDGLRKPTGLAFLDRTLWVQLERDLAMAPFDTQGMLGELEPVLTDLPYNGRSQGTLSVTLDRTLLFTTTGAIAGGDVVAGSGMLWELDPAHPDAPTPYAEGFRNPYAHTVDGDGQVWATDISDGGGQPEELNAVARGGDHGWPLCMGDREPVAEHGGTAAACADTERPIATFPAEAMPTSVVVSPWRPHELIVALLDTGEVVTVATGGGAGLAEPELLASGFDGPQHLLVVGAHVLVGDHERGVIYRIGRR